MTERVQVIGTDADRLKFWCPGCDDTHVITIAPHPNAWDWDGNTESPTIAPSILVRGGEHDITCHSFIREGSIQYLNDSTHSLAGQTVNLSTHTPDRRDDATTRAGDPSPR